MKKSADLAESLQRESTREALQSRDPKRQVVGRRFGIRLAHPKPRSGLIPGDDSWAEKVDELLEGFGEMPTSQLPSTP